MTPNLSALPIAALRSAAKQCYFENMKAAIVLAFLFAHGLVAQPYSAFAPRAIRKIDPHYTDNARQAHVQGTVVLYAEIGADGLAHHVRVIRGLGYGLDGKAIEALRLWRFAPALKDGVPVATPATIEIPFRLPAGAPVRV